MSFELKLPALKHMANANHAINLWKNCCAMEFNSNRNQNLDFKKKWMEIEKQVSNRLNLLNIFHNLQRLMFANSRHIGLELFNWLQYFCVHVVSLEWKDLGTCIIATKWTTHGKLDITETVKAISSKEDLNLTDRFQIACMFCVEESVDHLWRQLPIQMKKSLQKICNNKSIIIHHPIFTFWTDNVFSLITVNEMSYDRKLHICLRAIHHKNENAVRYFWSIMNKEEKDLFLDKFSQPDNIILNDLIQYVVHNGNGIGIACFLLSQMNQDKLDRILVTPISHQIFHILLSDLIFVEIFMSIVGRVLHVYSSQDVFRLLFLIAKLTHSLNGDKVRNCFTQLWNNVSIEQLGPIIKDVRKLKYLCVELCISQDVSNMELLFNDVNVMLRRRVLSQCLLHFVKVMENCIDFNFFLFVVVKFISSDKEIVNFRQMCITNAYMICNFLNAKRKDNWAEIDKFLGFLYNDANEICSFIFYWHMQDGEKLSNSGPGLNDELDELVSELENMGFESNCDNVCY